MGELSQRQLAPVTIPIRAEFLVYCLEMPSEWQGQNDQKVCLGALFE